MKQYTLIRNIVYVFLLGKYNNNKMPSYVRLGKECGLTRQTVSIRVKQLIKDNLITIDDNKIVQVANPLDIDIDKLRPCFETNEVFIPKILRRKLFEDGEKITRNQIIRELKCSRGNYYADTHAVVYGIMVDGELKYIGSTIHYKSRIMQHRRKRPYLTKENFVILADNTRIEGRGIERELIKKMQPEWNIMSKVGD